ncbi:hypothetical protein GOV09_04485 [Candidatus Woesearchaeota archaeon]|nr:hypothetical protein [Candidatus Woesearchaeota archaeon]
MTKIKKEEYKDLLDKYKSKLSQELEGHVEEAIPQTREYTQFRQEILPPHMNAYEKACQFAGKILNLKPDKKKAPLLQEAIESAHLNITPIGAVSFGILVPLLLIVIGSIVAFAFLQSLMFVMIVLILGVIMIKPLSNLPIYIASYWRLKASNQMVLCIFYVVTYMRHTSNIEKAIQFASEHLSPPLSLDMRKIVWDVETEKYDTLKQSLDIYLNSWRKYNVEFVEAFHLVESSLLEGDETRRLGALDRALDVILEETYEKMLHYAHHLKSPITMLHMLGIILPILGLVILPLVVSFMEGVSWLHLFFFYNIIIPVAVYSLGRSILTKRPTGYGDTDISEEIPSLKKFKNVMVRFGKNIVPINPIIFAIIIGGIILLIGLSPIIIHSLSPAFEFPADPDASFHLMEYQEDTDGNLVGPFGLGASILSLFVTLAFGLGFGLFFRLRSKNLIKIRRKTKKLEDEFASALFQLGNRLGDNIPAELAFSTVAEYMQDTASGKFFSLVSINIRKLGMSVQQAIFSPKYGAIRYFPSKIIESSMKVLVESVKKGPRIAAQSLTNMARYIKEIHRVNERLKDLMADIVSSMNSQIKFLTPAISGIVVGITSMITFILARLSTQLAKLGQGSELGTSTLGVATIFGLGIPTYFFQIVVGLYVVQIIYILTIMSNGIENGSDKLNERYQVGVNIMKSTILYCFIALFVMILFNFIASNIISSSL